jgi:hypothetical protein
MPKKNDENGNPIFPCGGFEVRVDGDDERVLVALKYLPYEDAHPSAAGRCPLLALSPEEAVHLASALQREVLRLKGTVSAEAVETREHCSR